MLQVTYHSNRILNTLVTFVGFPKTFPGINKHPPKIQQIAFLTIYRSQ